MGEMIFTIGHIVRVTETNVRYVVSTETKVNKYHPAHKSARIDPLLMYFFPNPNDFLVELSNEPLVETYTCEICDQTYYSTSQAVENGWGCPKCNKQLTEHDRFVRLIVAMGKGSYDVKSRFESTGKKVTLYHHRCKKNIMMRPSDFLFEGIRCACENMVIYGDAKKEVESHQGFRLIEFQDTSTPIRVLHENCRRTFPCDYYKFLNFPGCRCCNPRHMIAEAYEKKVFDLVGNEYSIVEGYVNPKKHVVIRHEKCGKEHHYKPHHFLDGQRCKWCTDQITYDALKKMLEEYSNGQYTLLESKNGRVIVQNMFSRETKDFSSTRVVQEILRPTPSDVLPVGDKKTIKKPLSQ